MDFKTVSRRLRRIFGQVLGADEPSGSDHPQALAAAPDVRASVHEDGLALLDMTTGRVFLCNETGSRIWQGMAAGLSPDAICQEISRDFGVASGAVRAHMACFLADLERCGLVIRKVECGL